MQTDIRSKGQQYAQRQQSEVEKIKKTSHLWELMEKALNLTIAILDISTDI